MRGTKIKLRKAHLNGIKSVPVTWSEWYVLSHLAKNKTIKEIASDHCCTAGAVQQHLSALYKKTGCKTLGRLMLWAAEWGQVPFVAKGKY